MYFFNTIYNIFKDIKEIYVCVIKQKNAWCIF